MGAPPTEDAGLAAVLTRIEVKLDSALALGHDHEARIRSLERKVWGAAGVGTVGGASLAGVVLALLQPVTT